MQGLVGTKLVSPLFTPRPPTSTPTRPAPADVYTDVGVVYPWIESSMRQLTGQSVTGGGELAAWVG